MGLLDVFRKKTWEEEHTWDGSDSMACPRCGQAMTKKYDFSDWWCNNCCAGIYDEDEDDDECDETLSVFDAALIWASHSKDEDYMFGYTEEELENAL